MKNENTIYKIINSKDENRRLDKRYIIIGIFIFMMVATFSFLLTRNMEKTNAADLSQFKAGNIMSDAVMRNYTSMTEAEIQSFLKKKNPCDKTVSSVKGMKAISSGNEYGAKYNYQYSYNGKTYHYHVENGKFVCLADEKFDNETVSHIIYQAAQDYKINPQVLIVLLEKEQGLITDKWPNTNYQYRSATGYGCPDNAACNSKYYGIKNQIRKAAELFDTVLSGGWTNYPLGKNKIRYSPNASCGSSDVVIENLATSALYRYTPYQPNKAALAAYTGTATCGAYGNRNFFIFFSDWFGSTQKVQYTFVQNYYNQNKNQTGKLTGETSCKNAKNENISDVVEDGLYYCDQSFEKGALFWNMEIKSGVKTDDKPVFIKTSGIDFYKNVSYEDRAKLGNQTGDVITVDSEAKSHYQILPFEKGYIKKVGDKYEAVTDEPIISAWAKYNTIIGSIKGEKVVTKNNSEYIECSNGYVVGTEEKGYFIMNKEVFEAWTRGDNETLMGKPIANINENRSTGIKWQNFENGCIVGNNTKGWYPSSGKIREVWQKSGFESGSLGFPKSDIKGNEKIGAKSQEYQNGVILGNDEKGYYIIKSNAYSVWAEYSDLLGLPVAGWKNNNGTKIEWYQFENGYIVGNNNKGWYISSGKSREVWQKSGFESGSLGFPKSNIIEDKENKLFHQAYEGGAIIWNDEIEPISIKKDPYNKWKKYSNLLGLPVAGWKNNNGTKIEWYQFENGYIVGNNNKGWYISSGKSREVWQKSGFESGSLGFPKSDFQRNDQTGMEWQIYEKGYIVGNDEKGWYESRGSIRTKWQKSGFESGKYGFPTSNIINGCQNYEHGKICQ